MDHHWRKAAAAGLALTLLVGLATPVRAQIEVPDEPGARRAVGLELQAYPAGLVGALHGQLPLRENLALTLRAGGNLTERRDWGKHDDEDGQGFGGGLGLRTMLEAKGRRWLAGARVDVWALEIDWRDDATVGTPARTGATETLVVQPTVELGLRLQPDAAWTLDVLLGVGLEINTDVRGEDVGEGAILLLGLTGLYGRPAP